MQYTVREAAKSAGIWDAAPTMEEITPQHMENFNSVVSSDKSYILCSFIIYPGSVCMQYYGMNVGDRRVAQ